MGLLCLTDLGGSPESHIKALMGKLGCSGDSSKQNASDLVNGLLNQIPLYGHREVLILDFALSTCDPGDIMETIQKYKESKIRCSVIGLSAEIFLCKHLCQETGGSNSVALDEGLKHFFVDVAHFPVSSIQIAFLVVVFPCLLLAYCGQLAYLMKHQDHVVYSSELILVLGYLKTFVLFVLDLYT